MSQRVVVMSSSGDAPRAPGQRCADCGRRGTIALVHRATEPRTVRRYCRRCWPSAQVRTLREYREEHRAFTQTYFRADEQVVDLLRPPPGMTLEWHWSVALGSLYRQLRYDRQESIRQAAR